jgi:hypothetical protein
MFFTKSFFSFFHFFIFSEGLRGKYQTLLKLIVDREYNTYEDQTKESTP